MFVGLFGETNAYDVLRCKFTAPDGTLLTAYPWTDPDDYRVWSNQWMASPAYPTAPMRIASNRLMVNAVGSFANAINLNASDYTETFDFKWANLLGALYGVYHAFRIASISAYWWFIIRYTPAPQFVLFEYGTLRASASLTMVANGLYSVKQTCANNLIKITLTQPIDPPVTLSYSSTYNKYATINDFELYDSVAPASIYIDNYRVSIP